MGHAMHSRRDLLLRAAAAAALARGAPARAAAPGAHKFVFVFNPGGWDPTRVFDPAFDRLVSMEPDAAPATVGGVRYVDHPSRPSVRAFFDAHHARTLVLNGMLVRSIAHEICTLIALTGTTSGLAPDWPAILAAAERSAFVLPHLVLAGPSYPGPLGVAVSRTGANGQLEGLVSGAALDLSDLPAAGIDGVSESLVDRYLQRRAAARLAGARGAVETALLADVHDAGLQLGGLKDLRYGMDFTGGTTLQAQAVVAADALAQGVSRCATLAHPGPAGETWDTHANNDALQAPLWESLFAGLIQLMAELATRPGAAGGTLADETTVVVLSEMGRTPLLNGLDGKDHWPYTSAMIVSPRVTGDRTVGGLDGASYGLGVDPASGELAPDAPLLSAEALGATLLQLADIDPAPYVAGVAPLTGVLA
jgi:uncharacterized protein (DUF1501 family)